MKQLLLLMLIAITACNKSKQIARINYSYQGCFGGGREELLITEMSGVHYANLKTGKSNRLIKISKNQADSIFLFIAAVKRIDEGFGCTTQSVYYIQAEEELIYKRDNGCQLEGLGALTKILFPE